MLNNFDYLWKRLLCVCVCVNSTFGRCCHCPCEKEETLYFKIDEADQADGIKKCFNDKWYEACKDKVLLLKEVKVNGSDVLKVTGSDNNWEITEPQENKFKYDKCDSGKNKWIIVEVITLDEDSGGAGDRFIFYVDEIKSVVDDNSDPCGVFENINCYSIKIIAANTSDVQDMKCVFFQVHSALEEDGKKESGPGLIGLDKLNVENVTDINWMFYSAIHKQATLEQLKEWRFSGENKVKITNLFYSQVKNLDFSVLNGWSSAKKSGTVSFVRLYNCSSGQVFVESDNENDFTAPTWYGDINKAE